MPKGVPNKRYTAEFKQQVIETMLREKLSYSGTESRFDVYRKRITDWERVHISYGAGGFYTERRGRGGTGRPPKLAKPRQTY